MLKNLFKTQDKKIKIEFCSNNTNKGVLEALEELDRDRRFEIREFECLSQCVPCVDSLYVLVRGKMIKGDNALDLVTKVNVEVG